MKKVESIDAYIAGFPENVQERLEIIRETIRKAAPDAQEAISYQIPTFKLNGNLVHFAAFKNHIGFYPAPSGLENFKDILEKYRTSKGTVQLPMNEPLPLDLIRAIVEFRRKENLEKSKK